MDWKAWSEGLWDEAVASSRPRKEAADRPRCWSCEGTLKADGVMYIEGRGSGVRWKGASCEREGETEDEKENEKEGDEKGTKGESGSSELA